MLHDVHDRTTTVTLTPLDVIRAATAVIRVRGYYQPAHRQWEGIHPTAHEVQNWILGAPNACADDDPHPRFDAAAAQVATTAAAVHAWVVETPSNASAHRQELAQAARKPVARPRDIAFLVSAVDVWQREQERATRAQQAAADIARSRYQGTVGERITRTVTVAAVVPVGTRTYGPAKKRRYLLKFRDTSHNVYIWPTAASSAPGGLPARNAAVYLTGTVTSHDTYRDTARTYLRRCRWTLRSAQPPR